MGGGGGGVGVGNDNDLVSELYETCCEGVDVHLDSSKARIHEIGNEGNFHGFI